MKRMSLKRLTGSDALLDFRLQNRSLPRRVDEAGQLANVVEAGNSPVSTAACKQ